MEKTIDYILGLVPKGKRDEARTALEELVRGAQYPVEIEVPESEVVKRYPVTEAIEIVKCRKEMLLHVSNFYLVVRPGVANNFAGGSLYQALKWYCESIDNDSSYTEEERQTNADYRAVMIMLLTLPLEMFGDAEYSVNLALAVLTEKRNYYRRLSDEAALRGAAPETEDDAIANAEFVESVKRTGAIVEAVEKLVGDGDEE